MSVVNSMTRSELTRSRKPGHGMPGIAGNGESQTMDTKVASKKLFGDLQRRDLGDVHVWTHNSWTHVMSDHAVISYIIPLAPDKTLVRTKWLVHEDAVEGVDYDLKTLTEVWVATNMQDASLVSINYRGTQDPAYEPGPFSPFTEAYLSAAASNSRKTDGLKLTMAR